MRQRTERRHPTLAQTAHHHPVRAERWVLAIIAVFICAIVTLLDRNGDREGEFGGRNAAEWRAALGDTTPAERGSAAYALGALRVADSATIDALIDILDDPDAGVRAEAIAALREIGREPRAAQMIQASAARVIESPASQTARLAAVHLVGSLGVRGLVTTGILLNRLAQDPSIAIRSAVASTLASVGAFDSRVRYALRSAMDDTAAEVRARVLQALSQVELDHHQLLPFARRALRDSSAVVREQGVYTLLSLRGEDSTVVVLLIAALDDPRAPIRRTAAYALGTFGEGAAEAAPALERVLTDASPHVRSAALKALREVRQRR